MATLRANGTRRDVIDRLCDLRLVYVASGHGDPDGVLFDLTSHGGEVLDTHTEE